MRQETEKPIQENMKRIQSELEVAKADYCRGPMVMFVGAFSAGKSTFINTILGQKDHCKVGVRPTTTDLHISFHGVEFHSWTRPALML